MQPYRRQTGVVAPLDRVDVDTDQIIPKQFLKRIDRTGFGQFAFFDWRYKDDGTSNPDFELNKPEYRGASVLVAGRNFGCGSSREHAPWALEDMGFRTIIAPSYADIFYNNCFKNGMLPIVLPEETVPLIAVLPGDGIGPEVVEQGLVVLEAVTQRFGWTYQTKTALIGGAAIDAEGTALPAETLRLAKRADAIYFGAVGGPKWDSPTALVRPEQGILTLRKALDLYA